MGLLMLVGFEVLIIPLLRHGLLLVVAPLSLKISPFLPLLIMCWLKSVEDVTATLLVFLVVEPVLLLILTMPGCTSLSSTTATFSPDLLMMLINILALISGVILVGLICSGSREGASLRVVMLLKDFLVLP